MSTAQVTPRLSPAAANNYAKQAIQKSSIKKRIMLPAVTVVPANTGIVNIALQNVGILRGCLIVATATVANTDGANIATLSNFGPANMFSSVVYNDLSNITRIQTTGAHLFMLDCIRRKGIMGAAFTNDNPGQFGAVWAPISGANIAHGANGTVQSFHYLPASYSDSDFRGSVFSNITNASQSIALTINPTVSVPAGTDSVNAIFGGVATANVTITSITIQVFQDVWDQLPGYSQLPAGVTPSMWQQATGDASGLLLPTLDMRWMYELKYNPYGVISNNVENTFPYTNQRQFLSTILQYGNPTRTLGTDLVYIRLVAANSYEWWKETPVVAAFEARRILGDDFPTGFYLFDSREKPINTVVSGNLNLVILPSTAGAGAYANVFLEDFALTSTITGASAIGVGN